MADLARPAARGDLVRLARTDRVRADRATLGVATARVVARAPTVRVVAIVHAPMRVPIDLPSTPRVATTDLAPTRRAVIGPPSTAAVATIVRAPVRHALKKRGVTARAPRGHVARAVRAPTVLDLAIRASGSSTGRVRLPS